jgi:hypothetical protein
MIAAGAGLRASVEEAPARAIVVKAADFSGQGGGKVVVERPGQGASPTYIHEWCTTGHWLEWTIEKATGGEYELLLKYGAKSQTERQVRINGQAVAGVESVTLSATGDWLRMKELKGGASVPLAPGKNVLRMTCLDHASVYLSAIELRKGDERIVIDPASFTDQGGGRVQAIVSDAAGFFRLWDTKGHALEWTIPEAAAGEYSLTLDYATGDVPVRQLRVNGKASAGLESFSMPYTGGWRNWCAEKLPAKVMLEQGRNVVRMMNIDGSLNVTKLRFTAAGKPEIVINGIDFSGESGGKVQVVAWSRQGYVKGWNKGQWVEWKVDSPAAGSYTIALRYASTAQSAARLEPQLNGKVIPGMETVLLRATRTVVDWREQQLSLPVTLKAGANVLRLKNMDEGEFSLEEIRFVPAVMK